jgi:hypothetical protein
VLDCAHHAYRTCAGFSDQEVLFMQAYAMLASAGAFQLQSALHQLVVQAFGGVALGRSVGVNQITEVKVTVAHMAY